MSDPFEESYQAEETEIVLDHEALARRDSDVARLRQDSPECYFDGKHFWVKIGNVFQSFNDTNFERLLGHWGIKKNHRAAYVVDIFLNNRVDWVGEVAGYRAGLHTQSSGKRVLVTAGPNLITPESYDETPVWDQLISDLFGPEQMPYFMGWWSTTLRSLYASVFGNGKDGWINGQALILVGPPGFGKSVIAECICYMMGSRVAKPYQYMTARTQFNGELAGAELLLFDDDMESDSSIRQRRKLGSHLKQICVGYGDRVHDKQEKAVLLHPRRRVLFCINNGPDDLAVIPPLEGGYEDKMIILKTIKPAVPSRSAKEYQEYIDRLKSEAPGIIAAAMGHTITADYHHNRYMVKWYCNPEVRAMLGNIAPTAKLEQLIRSQIQRNTAIKLTAETIEDMLRTGDRGKEADILFGQSVHVCGRLLGELSRTKPQFVAKAGLLHGYQQWSIAAWP
jgi:hypothetical protein